MKQNRLQTAVDRPIPLGKGQQPPLTLPTLYHTALPVENSQPEPLATPLWTMTTSE